MQAKGRGDMSSSSEIRSQNRREEEVRQQLVLLENHEKTVFAKPNTIDDRYCRGDLANSS